MCLAEHVHEMTGQAFFLTRLSPTKYCPIPLIFSTKLLQALRHRETHPICLSCSTESATEAISLTLLHSTVFHIGDSFSGAENYTKKSSKKQEFSIKNLNKYMLHTSAKVS